MIEPGPTSVVWGGMKDESFVLEGVIPSKLLLFILQLLSEMVHLVGFEPGTFSAQTSDLRILNQCATSLHALGQLIWYLNMFVPRV